MVIFFWELVELGGEELFVYYVCRRLDREVSRKYSD